MFLLCFGFCQLDGNEPESGQRRKSPQYPVWRERRAEEKYFLFTVRSVNTPDQWLSNSTAVKSRPLQLKLVYVKVLRIKRRPCSVITETSDSSDNSRLPYPEEKKASMILPPMGFMAKPPTASKSSGLRHRRRQTVRGFGTLTSIRVSQGLF